MSEGNVTDFAMDDLLFLADEMDGLPLCPDPDEMPFTWPTSQEIPLGSDITNELKPINNLDLAQTQSDNTILEHKPASKAQHEDTPKSTEASMLSVHPNTNTLKSGKKNTKRCTNASRTRMKLELIALREQEQQLRMQLMTLKKRPLESRRNSDSAEHANERSIGIWEHMAERQRLAKQQAEIENVRLRNKVRNQLQAARKIEQLVLRRSSQEERSLGAAALQDRRSHVSIIDNEDEQKQSFKSIQ